MKNDELKALYERFPWAWDVWYTWGNRWFPIDEPSWLPAPCMYQLKPKLPADLPEPTEDMMNRAVYLKKGEIKRPKGIEGFRGWVNRCGKWDRVAYVAGVDYTAHYCIDINDPNADEIIALNRPKQPKSEVLTIDLATTRNLRVQTVIDTNEQRIRDALIELGWTPPGESAWLRLDECEVELLQDVGLASKIWLDKNYDIAAMHLIKHGPSSVRVRKKS